MSLFPLKHRTPPVELEEGAPLRRILVLFFLWGFLTALNDVLVPRMRSAFALSYAHAALVPVVFFTTCYLFAPLSGLLMERLGYRRVMVLGLLIMGAGTLLFLPATRAAQYLWFLVAIGVIGAGVTVLQAAAAPYVSFLGPPQTAPGRFSLALGFNSLGTMVAPLFGGWLILRPQEQVSGVAGHGAAALRLLTVPYLFLGGALLLLALAVSRSRLPALRSAPASAPQIYPVRSVLRHGPLLFGALTAFLYAGAEIGIGSFLILFLSQPAILGVSQHAAALLLALYWGGAVAGRLLGWHLLRRWPARRVLACISLSAAVLVAVAVLFKGATAAAALLAVGLSNALIVPIVSMTAIAGLGPLTARASSVLVAANIGAALIPLAIGVLADRVGVHHAMALTIACYVCAFFYARFGFPAHLRA
jgi:MFS transporter, FHS family, L-fucose permease